MKLREALATKRTYREREPETIKSLGQDLAHRVLALTESKYPSADEKFLFDEAFTVLDRVQNAAEDELNYMER